MTLPYTFFSKMPSHQQSRRPYINMGSHPSIRLSLEVFKRWIELMNIYVLLELPPISLPPNQVPPLLLGRCFSKPLMLQMLIINCFSLLQSDSLSISSWAHATTTVLPDTKQPSTLKQLEDRARRDDDPGTSVSVNETRNSMKERVLFNSALLLLSDCSICDPYYLMTADSLPLNPACQLA